MCHLFHLCIVAFNTRFACFPVHSHCLIQQVFQICSFWVFWWTAAVLLVCSPIALESCSRASCLCNSQVTPLWCHSRIYDWFLFHAVCFSIWGLQTACFIYRYSSLCFLTLCSTLHQRSGVLFWKLDALQHPPPAFQTQYYCDSLFLCPFFVLYFMVPPKVYHYFYHFLFIYSPWGLHLFSIISCLLLSLARTYTCSNICIWETKYYQRVSSRKHLTGALHMLEISDDIQVYHI